MKSTVLLSLVAILVTICTVCGEEVVNGVSEEQSQHVAKKRSVDEDESLLLEPDDSSYEADADDNLDSNQVDLLKRQFRYGKRQFRYGKRQFRYGKRQFRYGKRQFRYGKRGDIENVTDDFPSAENAGKDKRQFRYGKRQFRYGKRQFRYGKRGEGEIENSVFPTSDNANDDAKINKRSSLFRYGKRNGGALFRYGKRDSGVIVPVVSAESEPLTNKRSSLFRFGKRGSALRDYGRSTSSLGDDTDSSEEEALALAFRKLLLRKYLENAEALPEETWSAEKRSPGGFHWGSDE